MPGKLPRGGGGGRGDRVKPQRHRDTEEEREGRKVNTGVGGSSKDAAQVL